MSYFSRIWGVEFSDDLRTRTALFSSFFSLIIGSFWLLGSLQKPIFYHLVGAEYHPRVNTISFLFILPIMIGYMALMRSHNKRRLLLLGASFYGVFFLMSGLFLLHPTMGMANTTASPYRLFGWVFYGVIETYGSFMVGLFWAIAVSSFSVAEAKRVFPWIIVFGQVGSILGSTVACQAPSWGVINLLFFAVFLIFTLLLVVYKIDICQHDSKPVSHTGLFEGLELLWERPYLRHILVVSTLYLVIGAFFDYKMHYLAHQYYPDIRDFAWFKGVYGQLVNGITLLFSLGGTRIVLEKLGVRYALFILPVITLAALVSFYFYPLFIVIVIAMVAMRSISFAINNPAKEILYIPEQNDVKFKTKSWIDMFAYRSMFALGSHITDVCCYSASSSSFVTISFTVSGVILGFWFYSVDRVGRLFAQRAPDKK